MAKVTKQRAVKKKKVATKKPARTVRKPANSDDDDFIGGIRPVGVPTTGIKLGIYGRSGTGKTTFASTAPGKKLLIPVGMDRGELSVSDVEDMETTPRPVQSTADLDKLVALQKRERPWDTLILDGGSELQNIVMAEVVGLDEVPTQLSWGIAGQKQWGDTAMGMKDKLRNLLQLADEGTNIIIICQERSFGDSEDSTLLAPSVAQALSPSVVGWLNPALDYVLQTFIQKKPPQVVKKKLKSGKTVERVIESDEFEFYLRTRIHDVYTIKLRTPRGTEVPEAIADPTYNKFLSLISGN